MSDVLRYYPEETFSILSNHTQNWSNVQLARTGEYVGRIAAFEFLAIPDVGRMEIDANATQGSGDQAQVLPNVTDFNIRSQMIGLTWAIYANRLDLAQTNPGGSEWTGPTATGLYWPGAGYQLTTHDGHPMLQCSSGQGAGIDIGIMDFGGPEPDGTTITGKDRLVGVEEFSAGVFGNVEGNFRAYYTR